MISLINDLEIIFVLIFLYYSSIGIFSMIGSVMITMATELFCLNKLLENLRYFHVVFLSVDLRVKRFNLTIRNTTFFRKNYFNFFLLKFYFLCLMFYLSDILWQRIT
jgi:hypothetical protein